MLYSDVYSHTQPHFVFRIPAGKNYKEITSALYVSQEHSLTNIPSLVFLEKFKLYDSLIVF